MQQYRRQGGSLTDPGSFVTDPLHGNVRLIQERARRYLGAVRNGFDYNLIFTLLINGNSSLFTAAITNFALLSSELLYSA